MQEIQDQLMIFLIGPRVNEAVLAGLGLTFYVLDACAAAKLKSALNTGFHLDRLFEFLLKIVAA